MAVSLPPTIPPETPKDCTAVNAYDWDTKTAYAVCMAESHGNPNATGTNKDGSTDRGLMQVNSIHADMVAGQIDKLYDPKTNLDIAYKLYQARGWQPWSAYNNGKYLSYL